LKDGKVLCLEEDLSVTPVNNISHTCQPGIGFLHQIDDLEDRSAGGHNVFYDEDPFSWMDLETAPELHFSINPLGKDRPDTEHPADFSADNDTTDSGGYHKFHVCVFEVLRDLTAEEMKVFGVLKDLRALKVLRAMESGSELKMPLQEGLRLAKDVENLFIGEFHGERILVVDG
jgi:hypothetical protein